MQDAFIFLGTVIDQIQKETNHCCDKENEEDPKPPRSWFQNCFETQLEVEICCNEEKKPTTCKNDSSWILSLPIPENSHQGITLEDCLATYTALEKIDSYPCKKCDRNVEGSRQVIISSCPEMLILHLKRFKFQYGSIIENHDKIILPIDDLKVFTSGNDVFTYKLYGIACHYGSFHGGHYFA